MMFLTRHEYMHMYCVHVYKRTICHTYSKILKITVFYNTVLKNHKLVHVTYIYCL